MATPNALTTPLETVPESFGGVALLERTETNGLRLVELQLSSRSAITEQIGSFAGETTLTVALPYAEAQKRRPFREWIASTWMGKAATAATAALTFYGASAALEAPAAHADSSMVASVIGTGDEGLWLHAGSPTGPLDRIMPEGDNFDVSCYEPGSNVNGYTDWIKGTDENSGDVGFASDAFLYTNTDTANENAELDAQGIPQCDTTSQPSSDQGTFTGVDNSPNTGTISVPSNLENAPWNFPTTSSHDLVDHVAWIQSPTGLGETLQVFMTVTGKNDAMYDPNGAFQEVAADANLSQGSPLWGTMQSQFDCHAEVVANLFPNKPSWDLDVWRPDLGVAGDIAQRCNPGPN